MKTRNLFNTLIYSSLLALLVSACGDSSPTIVSGNPNPPNATAGITITGAATAPGGAVARLENGYQPFKLAFNYIITPTYADIIGLLPVTNGTAELIEIDDDGVQVGDVLASAPLSITGEYSLELPVGRALAANLVVRISNGGVSMRAMVVDQVVDINPISEYVLQKFVDDDSLTLRDLPVSQVIALQGRVREFDLTAEANLSGMLARLEADLGELVENEIEDVKKIADDGAVAAEIAGTWNILILELALHDSEANNFGTFNMSIGGIGATITASDANPGVVDIVDGNILIDTWTNLSTDNSGVFNIFNELILADVGDEDFSASLDTNGNLVVESPFEEELQTGECPEFGWRYPPTKLFVNNTGNGNALVNANLFAGVRYRTVDTTGGSCPNAIDPAQKDGDEASAELVLILKGGDGMNTASLTGEYGFVSLYTEVNLDGGIVATSTVGQANFDGEGVASVPTDGLQEAGFSRYPGPFFTDETQPAEGGFPVEYSVTSSGMMTLFTEEVLEGWVNDDGSIFGLIDVQVEDNVDVTLRVEQEMLIGVKLPSQMPNLEGAVYRLSPLALGAGTEGGTEIFIFGRNNTLTFGPTTATFAGKTRGYERGSDTGPVSAFTDEESLTFTVDGPGINGGLAMSSDDISVKGFVSADGTVLILRLIETTSTGDHVVGMMLGVKQ